MSDHRALEGNHRHTLLEGVSHLAADADVGGGQMLKIGHAAVSRGPVLPVCWFTAPYYTYLMEFADVVRKRRMVRHFTAEAVPSETIDRIVRLAQRGPSAGFSQGVSFVVVTRPEMRARIAEIAGEEGYVKQAAGFHPFISEAPVQIIICTSEKVYKDRYREPDKRDPDGEEMEWPVPYWHTDAGCALMLVLLAAVDEGLAGAFVGVWDKAALRSLLGIPEHFTPIGVTMIGHGAPDVPSPSLKRGRRPLDDVLHREHW